MQSIETIKKQNAKPEPKVTKAMARAAVPVEIVEAIGEERIYQEKKWPGHGHTVAEWILIMEKCLQDAKMAWAGKGGDSFALHEVRQVVAVGVACMEQNGVERRRL